MRWIATPFVLVMVAAIAGGAAAQPSASGDELIAYQGNGKIYVINPDGTGRRPIISGLLTYRSPGRPMPSTSRSRLGMCVLWLPRPRSTLRPPTALTGGC